MQLIDTHTHFYDEAFDPDRNEVFNNAINSGVEAFVMPGINLENIKPMLDVCGQYPGKCFPCIGLHPTEVKPDYKNILSIMEKIIGEHSFIAIGETGFDLYWDKTYAEEQKKALEIQIDWALSTHLPLILHCRKAFDELYKILKQHQNGNLTGVFHCFPGDEVQAKMVTDLGFMLGIGGVVTYKNSAMAKVATSGPLEHIVLETDAPYLPPVPYRGQRNHSAYLIEIANKIADLKEISPEDIARVTTENAKRLFPLLTTPSVAGCTVYNYNSNLNY